MSDVTVSPGSDRDWFLVVNGLCRLPAPSAFHKEFSVVFVQGGSGSFRVQASSPIYGVNSNIVDLAGLGQWVELRVSLENNRWVARRGTTGTGSGSAALPDPNLVRIFTDHYKGTIVPVDGKPGLAERLQDFASVVGGAMEDMRVLKTLQGNALTLNEDGVPGSYVPDLTKARTFVIDALASILVLRPLGNPNQADAFDLWVTNSGTTPITAIQFGSTYKTTGFPAIDVGEEAHFKACTYDAGNTWFLQHIATWS